MADVKVNITFNKNATLEKLMGQHKKAQFAMSNQALEDSNYYCKQDQSTLISSSLVHSDFENGVLRWQTPYARKQYYLDSARTDINPNAQKMWAHKAASEHQDEWLLIYDKVFKGDR